MTTKIFSINKKRLFNFLINRYDLKVEICARTYQAIKEIGFGPAADDWADEIVSEEVLEQI